jgi:cysteine desulfurase / selenocysteine lyase
MKASIQTTREDFPITEHLTYLASCGSSPLPRRVAEASKVYYDRRMMGEHLDLDSIFKKGKAEAAKLINAREEEIAFVKGTTEGVNTVASMLDYRVGDNIVLADVEFTSNVYPWMRAAKHENAELRVVKSRNDGIWPADFEKLVDNHTRVVAISHVQMANGFKCDLKEIARIAHAHGAYLAVDVIQSVGAMQVDSKDPEFDFMVAGSHKWLLGPSGMGLLYVRRDLIERFEPVFIGPWQEDFVYSTPIDFTFRPYKLSRTARRFELGGHPNIPSIMGFVEALTYINEIGMANIDSKNRRLFELVIENAQRQGLSIPDWAIQHGYRSSFVGYKSNLDVKAVKEKAEKNRIVIAPSRTVLGDRIRIAPHFFCSEDEVVRAVEVLGQIERGVQIAPAVA